MPKNQWALGFYDCCSYKDNNGDCHCIPKFFPQALCSPCCIDGEIHTILNQQTPCCCRMSTGGWCQCFIQIPIGALGPFGGIVLSVCCGIKTRNEVIEKYDISDNGVYCAGNSILSQSNN